jgi:hypothetical protein
VDDFTQGVIVIGVVVGVGILYNIFRTLQLIDQVLRDRLPDPDPDDDDG